VRRRILLPAAAALAAVAGGDATAATHIGKCEIPSGAKVLVRSGDGLLFRTRSTSRRRGTLYGCWRPTGRRTLLVKPRGGFEPFYDSFRKLSGRWALVETTEGARLGPDWAVFVTDLRRGRRGPVVSPMEFEVPSDADGPAIQRAVISARGNAAWAVRNHFTDPVRREVYKLEDGKVTRLDPGPDVEVQSLRLRRHALSWTSGYAMRSARLK